MKKGMRRMIGLGILIGLLLLIFGGAMAEGGLPTDPNLEAVRQEERIANMILQGPIRSYILSDTVVQLTQTTAPTLGGHGVWQISFNHPNGCGVQKMSVNLMMKDFSDSYTTVYRQEDIVSTYTSCEIVSAGDYDLTFFVTFADGSQYANKVLFTIADDTAHTSLNERVSEIVSAANVQTGNDVWAKALYLHDWLTEHAYYDGAYEYYGADGVLLRGYGVCDSYSKAYLMLCQEAGIPVSRVTGTAGQDEDKNKWGAHAWNAIEIDGEWYYVDATWDDPRTGNSNIDNVKTSGNERHDYFCLNDEIMSWDHENDRTLFETPCTSVEANWAIKNSGKNWNELGNYFMSKSEGQVTGIGGTYSGKIQEQISEGNSSFTWPCDDTFYTLELDDHDNWTGYYSYLPANSEYVTRRWTLLASKMSQTPFTVDGNICAVGVSYDSVNNQFIVCKHEWVNGVCTQCGASCTHIAGFDSQGLCILCGAACPHKHTTEEFTDITDVVITEIDGNNGNHLVSRTGKRTVTCDDCSEVLTHEENIQSSREEAHTYFNGKCTAAGCGHECTHSYENGICIFCDYVNNPACNITYDAENSTLQINGSGAVGINHMLPWVSGEYSIDRVMIGEDITFIGANVFAKLQDGVCIDFQQTVKPTIHENAFGGTMAICRYTSDDSSWSTNPSISGVSWAKAPTFNAMKMPDWQQVTMPRIVEKGQSVTLSTPIGQNIGAIQLTIKDTTNWKTALQTRINISEAYTQDMIDENDILHITFGTRVPEGEQENFIEGHMYNVELFAMPAADSDPILWEGYWNTILTVVPAEQTGDYPLVFLNKNDMEAGFYGLYITAYDPNASNVWIVLDGDTKQGRPGNFLTWIDGYNEAGTHEVYAVSMLADGTTRYSDTYTFTTVLNANGYKQLYTGDAIPVTFAVGDAVVPPENFPQTITAETDLSYTIHPVNQTLGMDAMNRPEQVWYDSWLDDMTDWEAGMDLPHYLRRQEPDVPHSLLLNDETGSRTITIGHGKLLAGHTYRLNIEIRSAGCTPVVLAKTFTVVAEEDPDNPRPAISLYFTGKQSGPYSMNFMQYEDFGLHASAPGAAVVRFWNGDGYEYLNDWRRGEWTGGLEFDWKTWQTGKHEYFIQAYYGELEDDQPWDKLDWSTASISNIVTVNATQDEDIQKVIPEYSVSPNDRVVTQGNYFTVTLTNTDELNADGVYVGADLYNGAFGNHYDRNGNKIIIPTADLDPGYYTLAIYTETEGAGYAQVPVYFRVAAPETPPEHDFMITTTATPGANGTYTVESYEDFGVTFYAPDMDGYDKYYRFFDGERWWDQEWQRSMTLGCELDPGEWEVYAEVVYEPHDGGQNIRYESKHLEFTATSQGASGISLSAPGSYTVTENGTGYTVTLNTPDSLNEDRYTNEYWELALEEAQGPRLMRFSAQNGQALADSITFPAAFEDGNAVFEAGRTYKVRFHLNVRGYDPVNEEICFAAVNPSSGTQETLTLTVDDTHEGSEATPYCVPAHTPIRVVVTTEKNSNITAVRVLNGDKWEVWQRGDDYRRDWRFGSGTYGFIAQGTTDPAVWEAEDFDWENFDWDDLNWNITSNVVTVKMTTPNGLLGQPTLGLDKNTYARGETINATVGKVNGSEWYFVHIAPVNGNGDIEGEWVYEADAEATGTGTLTFTIPTAHIPAGSYAIWVDNNGTGYQGNGSENIIFEITAGTWTPTAVLNIPATISTNQNIDIYAYVPGASDIWLEIEKEGEPGWWNDRHEGGDYAVWRFGEAFEGTYIFTLYGHVNGEETEAETATCTVEAPNGGLQDVTFSNVPDVITLSETGSGINGSFTWDDNAEWYQVRLVYRGPTGNWNDDVISEDFRERQNNGSNGSGTLAYSIKDFGEPGIYEIQVIGGATGYNGTDSRKRILAIDNTASNGLTLTVNGSTAARQEMHSSQNFRVKLAYQSRPTAVRIMNGDNWEYMCEEDDDFQRDWCFGDGEVFLYAEATWAKGIDFDQDNWEEGVTWTGRSNVIVLNVTSPYGEMAAPNFTIQNPEMSDGGTGVIPWGDKLEIRIADAGPTAKGTNGEAGQVINDGWFFCNIDIERVNEDGAWWDRFNHNYDYPVHNGTNYIPTYNFEGNCRYRIEIGADAEGYSGRSTWKEFVIGARPDESLNPVKSFTVNGGTGTLSAQTHDELQLAAFQSGAEWYNVEIRKDGDEGWREDRGDSRSGMLLDSWRANNEGTYTLTAYAYGKYPEGETDPEGNDFWESEIGSVTVTVTATKGDLSEPAATMNNDKVYVGNTITITFSPVTAVSGGNLKDKDVEYSYWVHESNDNNWRAGDSRNGAGTLTLDTGNLNPGVYQVELDAAASGYNQSHNRMYFALLENAASDSSAQDGSYYFSVSSTTVQTEEDARIVAFIPGAEEISIFFRKGNNAPEEFDHGDGPGLHTSLCRGDGGEYQILLSGRINGTWQEPFPVGTVTISAGNQFKNPPAVSVNGSASGDTAPADANNLQRMTVSITRDPDAEGYHVRMRQYGDGWPIYDEFIDLDEPDDDESVTISNNAIAITIEDERIGPRQMYEIECWAHATGYECEGSRRIFILQPAMTTGMTLTVNPGGAGEYWTAEEARITAEAQGATAIKICMNNETRWYRGDDVEDRFTIWDEDTIFYAYATTDPISDGDSIDWNELTWDIQAAPVHVQARTEGNTLVPGLSFNNHVTKGDWFEFTIGNNGDARQMDMRIRNDRGDILEFRRYWAPGTYRVATTMLEAGERYWVNLSCVQDRHLWTEGPMAELYVDAPAQDDGYFRVNKTTLFTDEPFIPAVYMPGADHIWITDENWDQNPNNREGVWGDWNGDSGTNHADWEWWFDDPGNYTLYAWAQMDTGITMIDSISFRVLESDPWSAEPQFRLPGSLTTIEEEAFTGTAARVLIIPDSVTTIGSRAFADSDIQLVVIPENVTSIAENAFAGCDLQVIYGYGENAEQLAEQLHTLYLELIDGNG